MSDTVILSCLDGSEERSFELTKGDASIIITELRIRSRSNFRTPHEVLGKGGAMVALTDKELCNVVAEYLRYTLLDTTEYSQASVNSSFSFSVNRPTPHRGD